MINATTTNIRIKAHHMPALKIVSMAPQPVRVTAIVNTSENNKDFFINCNFIYLKYTKFESVSQDIADKSDSFFTNEILFHIPKRIIKSIKHTTVAKFICIRKVWIAAATSTDPVRCTEKVRIKENTMQNSRNIRNPPY